MSVSALLSEFCDLGITARPNGPNVFVSPQRALTPDLIKRIKSEKPALLAELNKIQREAGSDWEEIYNDPKQLKAFSELLMIGDMRRDGIVPEHYTSTMECKHCGPVPIFEGVPDNVIGCPWCFNRINDLRIPRT